MKELGPLKRAQTEHVAARPDAHSPNPPVDDFAIPDELWPALRSDHAGETGAVFIYHGVLSVTRDDSVTVFARRHLATEQRHLKTMEALVPKSRRSLALPVWRAAGWLTGALPALFGPAAVFRTIEAVETFVDKHYQAQTDQLAGAEEFTKLRDLLESCRLDEASHRDDAAARVGPAGPIGKAWTGVVKGGSAAGVALASRI